MAGSDIILKHGNTSQNMAGEVDQALVPDACRRQRSDSQIQPISHLCLPRIHKVSDLHPRTPEYALPSRDQRTTDLAWPRPASLTAPLNPLSVSGFYSQQGSTEVAELTRPRSVMFQRCRHQIVLLQSVDRAPSDTREQCDSLTAPLTPKREATVFPASFALKRPVPASAFLGNYQITMDPWGWLQEAQTQTTRVLRRPNHKRRWQTRSDASARLVWPMQPSGYTPTFRVVAWGQKRSLNVVLGRQDRQLTHATKY